MKEKGTIGKKSGWEGRVRPGCIGAQPNRKAARRLAKHTALWQGATKNWDRNRKDRLPGAAKSEPGSFKKAS
jgi:hypothetical protein